MNAGNTYLCIYKYNIHKRIAKRGANFGALEFIEKNVRMYKNVILFFGKETQKGFQEGQIFEPFGPNSYE